jgi:hypothetical protein
MSRQDQLNLRASAGSMTVVAQGPDPLTTALGLK